MASETSSLAARSYFEDFLARLKQPDIQLDDQTKKLVAATLTIRKFRDLLHAPDADFATGFSFAFVKNTMKEDFNRVIAILSDYRGTDRRGIQEANGLMKPAERYLYRIMTSLQEQDKQNSMENTDIRVQAFQECRDNLDKAYLQLEHLSNHFPPDPLEPKK